MELDNEQIYQNNENDDNTPRKKMSPKRRFRALVRLVIANTPWMLDFEMKFGTKMYAMKRTMKSNLALEHKAILNKNPEDRTDEENEAVYKIIGGFKCFRKYPEHVKMLLASYSHFCYFGPDRVIVRENHYATSIFFIISGEVNIIEEKYDVFLNETERIITETLTAGDVFGEICLLHNLPRMETIVSATPVEFLVLKRDDFDVVLKGTVKEEWDFISSLMQSFDYFREWDKVRIGECCMQSVIKNYKKADTILGDGYGRKNYVHFVIEGTCSLVEHLRVEETKFSSGVSNYRLYDDGTESATRLLAGMQLDRTGDATYKIQPAPAEQKRDSMYRGGKSLNHPTPSYIDIEDRMKRKSVRRKSSSHEQDEGCNYFIDTTPASVKKIYMQVCVFGEKACFSLGEPMQNRRVVAVTPVTCLQIPGYLLLGRDAIWLRIKQFLTKRIPTTNAVFAQFVRQRQWRQYKTELVKPYLTTYCNNWYANIPYTVRVFNDFDFKPKATDPTTRQELN